MPIDQLPPQEQVPAAPMVVAAYSFVWIAFLAYVLQLVKRVRKVEADLAALEKAAADGRDERRALHLHPGLHLIGIVFGWILGGRAAKDAYLGGADARRETAKRRRTTNAGRRTRSRARLGTGRRNRNARASEPAREIRALRPRRALVRLRSSIAATIVRARVAARGPRAGLPRGSAPARRRSGTPCGRS